MKKILTGIVLTISLINSAFAQQDDDDFLLNIPAIVASQGNSEPAGISKLRELNGQWEFSRTSDEFESIEYFRFDGTTARSSSNPQLFFIDGDSSIFSDFFSEWCDGPGGLITSYSTEFESYLVLCDWGRPDFDLGSLYSFDTVSTQFPFRHFFYIPSTGELSTPLFDNGTANQLSTTFSAKIQENSTTQNQVRSDSNASIDERKQALYAIFKSQELKQNRSNQDTKSDIPSNIQKQFKQTLEAINQ